MIDAGLDGMDWRKSSYSNSINCVEVAYAAPDAILVRDSKTRDAGHLTFTRAEWREFVLGAECVSSDLDT
jgi:hypothetical protein